MSRPSTVAREIMDEIAVLVREQEALIIVHPADYTTELRKRVETAPRAGLAVSKYVHQGRAVVIHPRLLDDLRPAAPEADE
jgi:hypothetical protein